MRKRFNLYDKVRIKRGSKEGKIGVIMKIVKHGDRYAYTVSNHYNKPNYILGVFYPYQLEEISTYEYIENLTKPGKTNW